MIVIIVDIFFGNDVSLLHRAYQGIEDVTLLVNPTCEEVDKVLMERPGETLMCMGHGYAGGLFGGLYFWGKGVPVLVGDRNIELLRDRDLICIWCHASDFSAAHPELRGFFSGMFISNAGEAATFGFDADEDDIYNEVTLFAERVNKLLKDKTSIYEWPGILRSQADLSKDFIRFNYAGLKCSPNLLFFKL